MDLVWLVGDFDGLSDIEESEMIDWCYESELERASTKDTYILISSAFVDLECYKRYQW